MPTIITMYPSREVGLMVAQHNKAPSTKRRVGSPNNALAAEFGIHAESPSSG